MKNYYDILGIEKDAQTAEIKKKYKELAMKYHPDRNTKESNEEKFKEISEAYKVLSDPKSREQYDLTGSTENIEIDPSEIFKAFFGQASPFGSFGPTSSFGPIFGSSFESNSTESPFTFEIGRGNNHNVFFRTSNQSSNQKERCINITIPLEDLINGEKLPMKIKRNELCKECYNKPIRCTMCKDIGEVIHVVFQIPCSKCGGIYRCKTCNGTKTVKVLKDLIVDLSKAVNNEYVLLPKSGDYDHETKTYINQRILLNLNENPRKGWKYNKNTQDLEYTVKIDLIDIFGGFSKNITTLDNKKIVISFQPGQLTDLSKPQILKNCGIKLRKDPVEKSVEKGNIYIFFKLNSKIPSISKEKSLEIKKLLSC